MSEKKSKKLTLVLAVPISPQRFDTWLPLLLLGRKQMALFARGEPTRRPDFLSFHVLQVARNRFGPSRIRVSMIHKKTLTNIVNIVENKNMKYTFALNQRFQLTFTLSAFSEISGSVSGIRRCVHKCE